LTGQFTEELSQPFRMKTQSRSKLVHLLISKSMAEALLVTAIAVGFYFATTNRHLRGVLDRADSQTVTGWVVDESRPATRVEVQLFIDDTFIADAAADQYRPDVREAKRAEDDWHGFVVQTPALRAGEHEARVYALYASGAGSRRTLQLIGNPFRFRVAGNETKPGSQGPEKGNPRP
jgi:hypothetical protein